MNEEEQSYQVRFKYIDDPTGWCEYAPVYRVQLTEGCLFFYEDKDHTKARAFNVQALRRIEMNILTKNVKRLNTDEDIHL